MHTQTLINLAILGILILVPQAPELVEYREPVHGELRGVYQDAIAYKYRFGGEFEKRFVSERRTPITSVYPQLRYQPFVHEQHAHSALVSRFGPYPHPYRQVII